MKIGDYCRTKDGFIARLIEKNTWYKFDGVILEEEYPYNYLSKEHAKELIIKSSPNIIDLIEEGDYVNGKLVIEHAYQKGRLFVSNLYIGGKGFTTCEDYSWELTKENEDRIETIVTHEQFESMEYKVVE